MTPTLAARALLVMGCPWTNAFMPGQGQPREGRRVLICGSRTFSDANLVCEKVMALPMGSTVVHGGAKGADSLADFYAREMRLDVEVYPADWKQHGPRAGYLRNQQMLDEGKPTEVIAFVDKPLSESKGTAMMVQIAAQAGLPVDVVTGGLDAAESRRLAEAGGGAVSDVQRASGGAVHEGGPRAGHRDPGDAQRTQEGQRAVRRYVQHWECDCGWWFSGPVEAADAVMADHANGCDGRVLRGRMSSLAACEPLATPPTKVKDAGEQG